MVLGSNFRGKIQIFFDLETQNLNFRSIAETVLEYKTDFRIQKQV